MKKMFLLVAAVLTLSGSSHAATHDTERLTVDNCQVTRVTHVNSRVTATGRCVVSGKPLHSSKVKWSSSYRLYDESNNACGASPVRVDRSSFTVPSVGAAAILYRFQLSSTNPMKGKILRSSPIAKRIPIGGKKMECGMLGKVQLPSTPALCARWPGQDPFEEKCGVPNSWISWSSLMTMSENFVSLGSVASRSGFCYRTRERIGTFPAPRSTFWLGYNIVGENLKCSDGVFGRIGAITLGLVAPSGEFCVATVFPNAWQFPIPPTWGGKLYVDAHLTVGFDYRTNEPRPVAGERVTGAFELSGHENGCSQLKNSA